VEIAGREDADACADAFLKYVREAVVIKLGAKGCLIKSRRERLMLPGFPVNAIDTTGAGDNFVAGFLAGLSKGLSLYDCGLMANAAGAIATTQLGATSAAVGMGGLAEFLKRAGANLEGVQELTAKMAKWQ
jgi:sugar/nucleoside kinase (ribokinase family)